MPNNNYNLTGISLEIQEKSTLNITEYVNQRYYFIFIDLIPPLEGGFAEIFDKIKWKLITVGTIEQLKNQVMGMVPSDFPPEPEDGSIVRTYCLGKIKINEQSPVANLPSNHKIQLTTDHLEPTVLAEGKSDHFTLMLPINEESNSHQVLSGIAYGFMIDQPSVTSRPYLKTHHPTPDFFVVAIGKFDTLLYSSLHFKVETSDPQPPFNYGISTLVGLPQKSSTELKNLSEVVVGIHDCNLYKNGLKQNKSLDQCPAYFKLSHDELISTVPIEINYTTWYS